MAIAGIICEYNPFHRGHAWQLQALREHLGPEGRIVCVMSGNFVQRGEFALLDKHSRALAAVQAGADLVLELPLPWATASAEHFARGGVGLLAATGVVDTLCFGSESGDGQAIRETATLLMGEAFSRQLRQELESGCSFPAARQRAAEALSGKPMPLLAQPNDLLGVEYAKAVQTLQARFTLLPLLRQGAVHDGEPAAGYASASYIRERLRRGEEAACYLTRSMATRLRQEQAAGRAPVDSRLCERAILARLRLLTEADFAACDEGNEGLHHRVFQAVRQGCSVEEILSLTKTKRYPHARLRRLLLRAYLGVPVSRMREPLPYLRPLAIGKEGRGLLREMKKTATLPLVTQPAQVRRLGAQAVGFMELEARATDLYVLARPVIGPPQEEWRRGAVLWKENADGV